MQQNKAHFGIALSGGGTRGFAHLGVLQALNEHGIQPDIIAGTSAGAIAGAMYASGIPPKDIHELLKSKDVMGFTRLHFPRKGLFTFDGLIKLLETNLDVTNIEELPIPLTITATNLNKGCPHYFYSGNIIERVVASASIPVLFAPVEIDGYFYCDGGVYDNLPVKPLLNKCEKIIGVNISPIQEETKDMNLIDVASRSFQLTVNSTILNSVKRCDMFIEPEGVRKYGLLDSSHADDVYNAGYFSALAVLREKGEKFARIPNTFDKTLLKLTKMFRAKKESRLN